MDRELLLGGKYTFKAGGQKLVVAKKPVEHLRHVLMKAMLWALYLPSYPELRVEVPIGYKYKPDVVALDAGEPVFWAEAGRVGNQKLKRILKRFSQTHFAFAVWGPSLASLHRRAQRRMVNLRRGAPIDLIEFPEDAAARFIDPGGSIRILHRDLHWRRIA
jgi:hypothetical protein